MSRKGWAVQSGLSGDIHVIDFPEDIPSLQSRTLTPGAFFLSACDGKFTDQDLSDEGNAFTAHYFNFESGQYLADYDETLGQGIPAGPNGLYYIADSWENFDVLKPVLDRRLAEWRARAV